VGGDGLAQAAGVSVEIAARRRQRGVAEHVTELDEIGAVLDGAEATLWRSA